MTAYLESGRREGGGEGGGREEEVAEVCGGEAGCKCAHMQKRDSGRAVAVVAAGRRLLFSAAETNPSGGGTVFPHFP